MITTRNGLVSSPRTMHHRRKYRFCSTRFFQLSYNILNFLYARQRCNEHGIGSFNNCNVTHADCRNETACTMDIAVDARNGERISDLSVIIGILFSNSVHSIPGAEIVPNYIQWQNRSLGSLFHNSVINGIRWTFIHCVRIRVNKTVLD